MIGASGTHLRMRATGFPARREKARRMTDARHNNIAQLRHTQRAPYVSSPPVRALAAWGFRLPGDAAIHDSGVHGFSDQRARA